LGVAPHLDQAKNRGIFNSIGEVEIKRDKSWFDVFRKEQKEFYVLNFVSPFSMYGHETCDV